MNEKRFEERDNYCTGLGMVADGKRELIMAGLEKFTLRIDPSSVYFFRFILEGYDNLFMLGTLDQLAGLVEVRAVKSSVKDFLLILRSLKSIIGLDRMDSRCNVWITDQLMI